MSDQPKLVVEGLVKIFGRDTRAAAAALAAGASRADILARSGDVAAIAGVSFAVRAGEIFVVMGLSGSGKSTLIRCLNRLIEPTAGSVRLDGEDVLAAGAEQLRQLRLHKMAMVFQHFALFPHKTVAENVEFGLKARGIGRAERRRRAMTVLEQVGLAAWADRPPTALSGGMQQRVGLARSLAVDPELLLMDEAFSALDPLIRRDMQDELLDLQRRVRKTIVFITHDLNEALTLGDRIAIMKDGRFVQVGTPQQIVAEPADDYVAAFTRDIDRGRVFTVDQVMRPAAGVARKTDIAGDAIARPGLAGQDWLVVLDPEERPVGTVTVAALRETMASQPLGGLMQPVATVARGSRLADLYAKCAGRQPIAVIDEAGRLAGCIDPLDLFALLAGGAAPPKRG
ncbi:MAG: glycine betaine/L-proline ABC transporter ATP-binding protein [Dongiaceae bacterium]